MTFRIADTFTAALDRLTAQEKAAAKQAAFDLQVDPSAPGLSLHRVDRSRDRDFWTARVTRDLRLVLHKRAGDTLLAWVGHHDAAYSLGRAPPPRDPPGDRRRPARRSP